MNMMAGQSILPYVTRELASAAAEFFEVHANMNWQKLD
jgi:hypothetical protein